MPTLVIVMNREGFEAPLLSLLEYLRLSVCYQTHQQQRFSLALKYPSHQAKGQQCLNAHCCLQTGDTKFQHSQIAFFSFLSMWHDVLFRMQADKECGPVCKRPEGPVCYRTPGPVRCKSPTGISFICQTKGPTLYGSAARNNMHATHLLGEHCQISCVMTYGHKVLRLKERGPSSGQKLLG